MNNLFSIALTVLGAVSVLALGYFGWRAIVRRLAVRRPRHMTGVNTVPVPIVTQIEPPAATQVIPIAIILNDWDNFREIDTVRPYVRELEVVRAS